MWIYGVRKGTIPKVLSIVGWCLHLTACFLTQLCPNWCTAVLRVFFPTIWLSVPSLLSCSKCAGKVYWNTELLAFMEASNISNIWQLAAGGRDSTVHKISGILGIHGWIVIIIHPTWSFVSWNSRRYFSYRRRPSWVDISCSNDK